MMNLYVPIPNQVYYIFSLVISPLNVFVNWKWFWNSTVELQEVHLDDKDYLFASSLPLGSINFGILF